MCSLLGDWLELVEALKRDGRHALAGRAAEVPEDRVVRLIPAHFAARLEAVAREERDRCGHLLVLRIAGGKGGGRCEVEAVLVVERLEAQNAAQLRYERIGHV